MYRIALIVFATITAASPVVSLASSFTTLYRFGGGNDGGFPPLIYHNGELYGTAPGNGTTNRGNVFKVNATTGDYHIVYAFQGGADGLAPENGVIYQGGKLYGTTTGGGGKDCVANGQDLGCGTIFSINLATKAETKLYSFPPNAENNFPLPRGITFLSGILYGTSSAGGVNSDGSVFSLNPATGSFTTIYSFQGTGATYPSPRLLYENGLFYGTTEYGGTGCPGFHGCGTAFSINPTTGAESVLYAFVPKANGRLPASNIIYHAGSLIGDTDIGGNKACKRGCGVSYAINVETGVETVLEDFESGDQHYSGQTLVGGSDYETLPTGSGGNGEIIRVDLKTGKQVVLYTFTGGADGSSPVAPLTYHDGGFYGTTNGGNGTIFKFVP